MKEHKDRRGLDMLRRVLRVAELLLPHETLRGSECDEDIDNNLTATENTESTSYCKVERDDLEA